MILKRSKHNVFEVYVTLAQGNDDLVCSVESIFSRCGVLSKDLVIFTNQKNHRVSVYVSTRQKGLALIKRFNAQRDHIVRARMRVINKESWQEKWAKGLKAFQLTECLDVVPAWRPYAKTARTPVFLRSINAFGTGLHETTRFISKMIESKKGHFVTFFDIGTGSGLLALVAYLHGAKKILAIDMDPGCIEAAKKNFLINKLVKYRLQQRDIFRYVSKQQFDFVAANLITHDLIQIKDKLVGWVKPGGFLAISGISLGYYKKIQKEFRSLPLRCLRIDKGQDWTAFLYQKKKAR